MLYSHGVMRFTAEHPKPHIANNKMQIAPAVRASVAARESAYIQSCRAMAQGWNWQLATEFICIKRLTRRLRHDAGRLGVETKGQSIPSRPFARLDQGQEPEVARNEPGERPLSLRVFLKQCDKLHWLWRTPQETMRPRKAASDSAPNDDGHAGLRQLA
jgi:hypothetical protein